MHRPVATDLLDLWERAARCAPPERALRLLSWALPDQDADALADLDLGLRDWHLLRLRRALFGATLAGYIDCPHCGVRLELELDARTLQDEAPLPQAPHYLSRDGYRFRLPSCRDLIAIANADDAEAAERELFSRCRLDRPQAEGNTANHVSDGASFDNASFDSVTFDGAAIDGVAIDDALLDDIDNGLATLAAERSLQLALACDACSEAWQVTFDPGLFLWEEIEARAIALLDDVHQLASAYGWSESEILSLGDARRAAYLSRVN